MKWHLTESRGDSEHTDELPVLSEEAILEFRSRSAATDTVAEDALESSIDALRDALDLAESRWAALETRLENQDRAIAELRDLIGPRADALIDPIPVLQSVVTEAAVEAVAAPEPVTAPEPMAAPEALPTRDDVSDADDESRAGNGHHALLERIASLESYIAGRADRWQAMEQELNARSRRISELEIELEQRIDREQRLEDRLHNENDRANQLRDKLRRMHRRIEEDEFESIDQDLDATRELVGREMEATRVRFRNDEPSEDIDFGNAPKILCLNPDLPDAFVMRKDAITIGRGPDCDIQIATDFVSRRHATIRREKNRTIIEDRSSTNGVFVNAVRIDSKALSDGDEIMIGESRFRFVAGEPLPELH